MASSFPTGEVDELSVNSQFSEAKATQAAALFLKLAGGRLDYLNLMKLLYMLDRTSLDLRGHSITNDQYFWMKSGPILSEVLDLINTPPTLHEGAFWSRYISEPANYTVSLKGSPGTDQLSERDEELIQEIYAVYGAYDSAELAEVLRKKLPEWTKVERGRVRVSLRKLLEALNKTQDEIAAIEDEVSHSLLAHSLLGVS